MFSLIPVANEVYRSEEPQHEDYGLVKKSGVVVVLVLEGDVAEIEGLYPVAVIMETISFWQMHFSWWAIPAKKLDYLVDLVARVSKPILVHCKQGRDRTGLVCAAYRVKYCGWTPEDAMAEALNLGYHNSINGGLNDTWKKWLELMGKWK